MKKISGVLAALATIAVAAPTVASAEGFGFRIGDDRDYYRDRDDYRGPRAEFYGHDRGLHRFLETSSYRTGEVVRSRNDGGPAAAVDLKRLRMHRASATRERHDV